MTPTRALRPCSRPLCPELVSGGYCAAHGREVDEDRGTADERGYNTKWRRIRAQYIKSRGPNPRCDECGRTAEEAGGPLEVDHIDGRGPRGNNAWSNLQLLCKEDHSRKTAAQTRGVPAGYLDPIEAAEEANHGRPLQH